MVLYAGWVSESPEGTFNKCSGWNFSDGQVANTLLLLQGAQVRSLGWEDPLGEGMATHSSILAWRIPWMEKPGGLQSVGWQSRTQLKQLRMHAWVFQWSLNLYLFQHRYFAFCKYLLLAIVGHQVWEAGRKCSFLVLHSHYLFDFIILVCSNDVRNNSKIYYILICRWVLQCNSPSKSEMLIMEKIYNATSNYFKMNFMNLGGCCCPVLSCVQLCDPMDDCSTPSSPVHHYLPEFAQIHIHWVDDAL